MVPYVAFKFQPLEWATIRGSNKTASATEYLEKEKGEKGEQGAVGADVVIAESPKDATE